MTFRILKQLVLHFLCHRLKKLSEDLELFHVQCDDKHAVDWLKEHILSHDKKWNVWVNVEVGGGRGKKFIICIFVLSVIQSYWWFQNCSLVKS